MSYIGNSLTQQSFTGGMDQFNGNASNTAFGLSRTINTAFDVEVYVESVFQRPGIAYNVSANTITFTSAPSAGSNNVVVVYKNFTATSVAPQQGSVVTQSLGNITNINAGTGAGLALQANNTTAVNVAADGNVQLPISNAKILNSSGRPILQQSGSVIQTQYVTSGTRVSTTHSTTFTEPSTDYRVTITPTSTSSLIIVKFYVPFNQASAANILTVMRSFRSIGGTKSYNLTSAGNTNGSRNAIAGGAWRPQNGYDQNDMDMKAWQVIDLPGTTSAVSYGFETKPEGTNTTYWGFSGSDNGTWGWDSDIIIVAQEIAQ